MIMEISITEGPRVTEALPDTPALRRRDLANGDKRADLWCVTLSLDIRAPLSWWKQAKHYLTDVFWLRARPEEQQDARRPQQEDFEQPVPEAVLDYLNGLVDAADRTALQSNLPESFVRRGVTHTNLAVVRGILDERGHYNEGHWAVFCRFVHGEPRLKQFLLSPGTGDE